MHAFDNSAAQRQQAQWKADVAAAEAATPKAAVEGPADGEQ